MKRKSTIILLTLMSVLMTSCFVENSDKAKAEKIELLEQEIDSIKSNPIVIRDTVKVREKIESSAELTNEAKQLLNDITD